MLNSGPHRYDWQPPRPRAYPPRPAGHAHDRSRWPPMARLRQAQPPATPDEHEEI